MNIAGVARAWLADDPDPAARAEIQALLDGLPGTADELRDRFAGPLTFGTAGLRGRLRAGPNGMNLAVVTRAAAGLVGWLEAAGGQGPLVIGYDARHGSKAFAERTAEVATGAGREALLLPRPLPTPVLAHAVRALNAVAGVMVTASHNPPQDNGYKVYLGASLGGVAGAGAQIVPPADAEIEAAIQAVGALIDIKPGPPGTILKEEIIDGYVQSAAAVIPEGGPRGLTVAYTPLHGVGGEVFTAAFEAAGFPTPHMVPSQSEPDPDFPTVAFPNPEEPGAMDLLLSLATATNADIAIANDPDADRCAVAIPTTPAGADADAEVRADADAEVRADADAGADADAEVGGKLLARPGLWRALTGDQLGALLADRLISRGAPGTYATTIVSSSMLRAICAARGIAYNETLTGFKWIVRAAEELAFGYEEALGYCVAPDMVRDKDGITAALVVADLAATLKAEGRTLADRLDDLDVEFGIHRTDQLSARVDDLTEITEAMTRVRANPPTTLLGREVTFTDLLPDNDILRLTTANARVVIRPSGTEPKLKAYLEVVHPTTRPALAESRKSADDAMATLRTETAAALGL